VHRPSGAGEATEPRCDEHGEGASGRGRDGQLHCLHALTAGQGWLWRSVAGQGYDRLAVQAGGQAGRRAGRQAAVYGKLPKRRALGPAPLKPPGLPLLCDVMCRNAGDCQSGQAVCAAHRQLPTGCRHGAGIQLQEFNNVSCTRRLCLNAPGMLCPLTVVDRRPGRRRGGTSGRRACRKLGAAVRLPRDGLSTRSCSGSFFAVGQRGPEWCMHRHSRQVQLASGLVGSRGQPRLQASAYSTEPSAFLSDLR